MNGLAPILSQLYNRNKYKGMKLGLERIKELIGQVPYEVVHIAGTNGKGTLATQIACGLQKSGAKVGLFTSPHISSFRERIQIDAEMVSERELFELLPPLLANPDLTFFEITTLLAMQVFERRGVEVAVVETGLGGRLDATNALASKVCAITSIGYDHQAVLGESLELIGMEKGGIAKRGAPLFVSSSIPSHLIPPKSCEVIRSECLTTSVLQLLGVADRTIAEVLNHRPICRWEEHQVGQTRVIFDVAHNGQAFERLAQKIPPNTYLILAVGKERDPEEAKRILLPKVIGACGTTAPNGRCLPAEALELERAIASPYEAVCASLKHPNLLITGSFFVMSEARRAIGICEPIDPFELNER